MKKIVLSMALVVSLMQADTMDKELALYAGQKYKIDYTKQDEATQAKLKKEYADVTKLATMLQNNELKDDLDYKILTKLISIDVWTQKIAKDIKISDSEIQNLYNKLKPQTVPKYKLSNILVKDEGKANSIVKAVSNTSADKRLAKFQEYVKSDSIDYTSKDKNGANNEVEITKLTKEIADALKDKKEKDVIKVDIPNLGSQILYIETIKAPKDATLEESKDMLKQIAVREAIVAKIKAKIGE